MRTSVVIPTYQRRDAVVRLVRALAEQAGDGLEIIVVVDGSTDGSVEALSAERLAVPLRCLRQENAGQGAARNRGLESVEHDGLVWFLDDDMVPSPGLVAAHHAAHADGVDRVVMGPCLFPEDHRVVDQNRAWADEVFARHAATGEVTDSEFFSVANTSAPVAVWRAVGGLHEGFVGWGSEDDELGMRVLAAGIPVRYDTAAVAWHHQERGIRGMCRTKEEEGGNKVRFAELHPERLERLFPPSPAVPIVRRLAPLHRHPAALRLVARSLATLAEVDDRVRGGRRFFDAAVGASLLAGIASADADGPYVSWFAEGRPASPLPANH